MYQSYLSIEDAEKDRICRTLYPKQCLQKSMCEYFTGLPSLVSEQIHSMREIADVHLTRNQIREILGYSENSAKDRILDIAFSLPAISDFLHPLLYQHPEWVPIVALLEDLQVATLLCYKMPTTYMLLSVKLQNVSSLAYIVVEREPLFYMFLPSHLKRDLKFIELAVRENSQIATCLPEDMLSNRDFALWLIKLNSFTFTFLSPDLRNDRELILIAFAANWHIVEKQFGRTLLYLRSYEIDMLAHLIMFGQS